MSVLIRQRALEVCLSQEGVHEEGANNAGAKVEVYQTADSLPGNHYAWCMSLQQFCWRLATGGRVVGGRVLGGAMLADGTASVGAFTAWAHERGYVKTRPLRGMHVTFHFDSDNWADHVGMIVRVLRLGPVTYIRTVEGNTGAAGAVSDPGTGRDGVYVKNRLVPRGRGVFIEVPGTIAAPARTPVPKPTKPKRHILRRRKNGVVYTEPKGAL